MTRSLRAHAEGTARAVHAHRRSHRPMRARRPDRFPRHSFCAGRGRCTEPPTHRPTEQCPTHGRQCTFCGHRASSIRDAQWWMLSTHTHTHTSEHILSKHIFIRFNFPYVHYSLSVFVHLFILSLIFFEIGFRVHSFISSLLLIHSVYDYPRRRYLQKKPRCPCPRWTWHPTSPDTRFKVSENNITLFLGSRRSHFQRAGHVI
jgi:hypothetical protein